MIWFSLKVLTIQKSARIWISLDKQMLEESQKKMDLFNHSSCWEWDIKELVSFLNFDLGADFLEP